jgi:hypothetical protein
MRVRITKAPLEKAAYGKQVQGSLSLNPGAFGGADYTASDKTFYKGVKDTLSAVPRDKANLEAEGGETAFGPISGQSIPDHLKIVGKRHHEGGVPLNLPDDTFIFSDTASLKINDPSVLAMFNKTPKKGGYTPAELAKPYNINKYKSILLDPDSSKLERDTATIMIKNYVMKLGALALVQESMKGFPQGIPEMAKPYMEANGISEEDLMPELKEQADALAQSMGAGQQDMQMPQEGNPMMAEEMQQMAPDQAMQQEQAMLEQTQGQPSYPEQMPSGAPVASPEMMQQMAGAGAMPPPDMMPQEGMMQYGGMPYAAYGMSMGGYDMPFYPEMAYGGMPKFQGTGQSTVTVNSSSSNSQISDSKKLGEAYKTKKYKTTSPQQNTTYYNVEGAPGVRGRGWVEGTDVEWNYSGNRGGGSWNPTVEQAVDQYCKNMQNPKSKLFYGVAAEVIAEKNFKWMRDSDPERYAAIVEKLKGCKAGGAQENYEFVEESGGQCYCENPDGSPMLDESNNPIPAPTDENGTCIPNSPQCGKKPQEEILCKCEDPVTGEVKEFPIAEGEECVCEDGSSGQTQMGMGMGMQPQPHWSRAARTNVTRNAFMATEPASSNVVLTPSAQAKGAYEEYQTKVDQGLAALSRLGSGVMATMAGTTGSKQSMMKDLMGNALRESMNAVAGVQSRNVDRQRETNVQDATIANTNALARTQALQGALDQQSQRKNTAMANRNQRRFNTMGAMMDADKEMAARQNMNVTTPQYASEYEYGFIAPTGVQKPFTGVGGATLEDRIQHYLAKTGDYQEAFDMAYKEARLKSQYGGQLLANGGYVLASNVFPFIM